MAIYSAHEPSEVVVGVDSGGEFDAEGRLIELRFDTPLRKLSILSCYFPSGTSGPERQAAKYRFLDRMQQHLAILGKDREWILCGDINIAHQPQDLKNWKGNLKNSGFLPEERQWLTDLLLGQVVDVYRHLYPEATEDGYTWWSNRGAAYAKNVGWRIDYHLATPALAALARRAFIYKEEKFSDHAPLSIDYDFSL